MILSTQRIPGGDLVENGCFIEVKLANVCGFSDFARGTMREKMAIFKERNRVCRGPKFFNGGDVDENRHFIEENLVAHGQISIFYKILYEGNFMIHSRYNDDVVMMMRVYRPFPFRNRSSLSTHFVK